MKHLILIIVALLLFACSNGKKVFWCADHACINNKEKEAYFKKTMIVEVREVNKRDKKNKSELELIKKQFALEQKKEITNEKDLIKQARLEEKRKIMEGKELAKQARLEEKRKIKEGKELAKQVRSEEKKLASQKKSSKKKMRKTENVPTKKEIVVNMDVEKIDVSSTEFKKLVEKITKKNIFRSYPNINDTPN